MFGKRRKVVPPTKKELTPWEKAQRVHQVNQPRVAKAKRPSGHRFRFKGSTKLRVVLVTLVCGVALVSGYLLSPLSKVQSIEVVGNQHFSKKQILKAGNVKKNDWIFPYLVGTRDQSAEVYKKQPKLLRYRITRTGVNRIKISVKENLTAGYVFRNKMYYTILDNGKVIKKTKSEPSGDYPVFKNFHTTGRLSALLKQYRQLPAVVRAGISEIDYAPKKNNPNLIHLYMNDGNEVYAVLPTFAAKMKYYPQMAAAMKQKGVIDLEVGAYSYPFSNRSKEKSSQTTQKTSGAQSSSSSQTSAQWSSGSSTNTGASSSAAVVSSSSSVNQTGTN
ncbi:cell division protein FtsQ/DivIB [Pediococcus siamensis]|uniref:cell division protein FtsQ/DivIB n=1 Tax=Pediococcus siamensis TaxID=381829 RepID=UPI00399F25B3